MSQTETMEEQPVYVIEEDGKTKIQEEGYITESTIDDITFTFDKPREITESTADKNKGKQPVSYTKKGRSAYAPGNVNYLNGAKTAVGVFAGCIIQFTDAFKSANYKYGKSFANIAVSDFIIEKMISDAKNESNINLAVKPNTEVLNGFYWLRCNLDKLGKGDVKILVSGGSKPYTSDLDKLLIDFGQSLLGYVVFTISASMNNDNMSEELDLEDGQYYITMKPKEIWIISETDIQGPTLANTNARKNEGADVTENFYASGKLAEFAMKKLRLK